MVPRAFYGTDRRVYLFLFLIILIFFNVVQLSAQKREQIEDGTFRIKVSEAMAMRLEKAVFKKESGSLSTGDNSLDAMNKKFKVADMKRVFPYAGKFEDKHRKYGLHRWYEVSVPDGTVLNAMPGFKSLTEIEKVEPVYKKAIIGSDNAKFGAVRVNPGTAMGTLPGISNDPMLGNQWHYNNVGQTGGTINADIKLLNAWAIETGNPNVIVSIHDGGIDVNHEDLASNMWINTNEIPGNNIDDDGNGYIDDVYGYNFVMNTGTVYGHEHGTHVGGTVAATNHNGLGVAGVAGGSGTGDGARLMSCEVFSVFGGAGGFAQSYVYAADNGAVISQNSWGYIFPDVYEQSVLDGIDYFIAEAGRDEFGNQVGPMNGGIVIFAAGNSLSNENYYPGYYSPVLSVASTNHNDMKSWYSNYGAWVDIAAPGGETGILNQGVLSTLPSNQYGYFQGTSMACPHVSGVGALVVSRFGGGGFTPAMLRNRLIENTDNIDAAHPEYAGLLGAGRLNAFKALQGNDEVAPDPITDLVVISMEVSSVTLSWTSPYDEGSGSASVYDLRYSLSPIDESNFYDAVQATLSGTPKGAGQQELVTVHGLQPATEYFFALKSSDYSGNTSLISNVSNGTTALPPVLVVSPESLSTTLLTAALEIQQLTIANTGPGVLTFQVNNGSASFINVFQEQGSLSPGESTSLDVTFNASNLFGGIYYGELHLQTNDPEAQFLPIPVTLEIVNNGFPIASINTNSIEFGEVVVGASKSNMVQVHNGGSESLFISDVLSDSESFSTDFSGYFEVPPFTSKNLRIKCTPVSSGLISGNLQILTNDPANPSIQIVVSASAVDPPIIQVDAPQSFTKDIHKNTKATEHIVIRNVGSSPLRINLKNGHADDEEVPAMFKRITDQHVASDIFDVDLAKQKVSSRFQKPEIAELTVSPPIQRTRRIVLFSPDPDPFEVAFLFFTYPEAGIYYFPADYLSQIDASALEWFDAVWVTNNFPWSSFGVTPELIGDLLADYIDMGGKVILNQMAASPFDDYKLAGRFVDEHYSPFTESTEFYHGFATLGNITMPDHPIMSGVNWLQYYGIIPNVGVTSGAEALAYWDNGDVLIAANRNVVAINILPASGYGGGIDWAGDLPQIYRNALNYIAGPTFLSYMPTQALIYPGGELPVRVTFDARYFEEGSYTSSIDIYSNDPGQRLYSIPVAMNVLGDQFTISSTFIEEWLMPSQSATHVITLTNNSITEYPFEAHANEFGFNALLKISEKQNLNTTPSRIQSFDGNTLQEILRSALNTPNAKIDIGKLNSIVQASVGAQTIYATGFEEFANGDVNQMGWYSQGPWEISNAEPYSGEKHLRFSVDAGNPFGFVGSPVINTPENPSLYSSASAKIRANATRTFNQILFYSIDDFSFVTALMFDDYGISVIVHDGLGGGVVTYIGVQDQTDYVNWTIEVQRNTSMFTLFANDKAVFSGEGFAGNIGLVQFYSHANEGATGYFDVDEVAIYDGKKNFDTPSYLTLAPRSGLIGPGESIDIVATFDATDLAVGIYPNEINIVADQSSFIIPAILNVTYPQMTASPSYLFVELMPEETSSESLFVEHSGDQPMPVTVSVFPYGMGSLIKQTERLRQNGVFSTKQISLTDELANALRSPSSGKPLSLEHLNSLKGTLSKPLSAITLYATDFENFPDGTLNSDGWWSEGMVEITSLNPASGSKHIRMTSFEGEATYAFSPAVAKGTRPISSASMDVNLSGPNHYSSIHLYAEDYNYVTSVDFYPWGISATAMEGDGSLKVVQITDYLPIGYVNVTIEVSDSTSALYVYLNNTPHYIGQAFSNNISSAFLVSQPTAETIFDIDNFAIFDGSKYSAPSNFISVTPLDGIINPNEALELLVSFDATGMGPGYHGADIVISGPFQSLNVPAILYVPFPQLVLYPDWVYEEISKGEIRTREIQLQNVGSGTFTFEARVQQYGFNGAMEVMKKNNTSLQSPGPQLADTRPFAQISRNLTSNKSLPVNPKDFVLNQSPETGNTGYPMYATNFEDFYLGDINQQGWYGWGSWIVDNANPFSGSHHIRLTTEGAQEHNSANTPWVGIGSQQYSSATMRIMYQGSGAHSYIIPHSPSYSEVPTAITITPSNEVYALIKDPDGWIYWQYVPFALPQGFFELTIEVERSTSQFKLYFGEQEVFSGQGLTGNIERLEYYVFNEPNSQVIMDVDDVLIMDGSRFASPFVSINPKTGMLAPWESMPLTLTLNATDLSQGFYYADVIFSVNGTDLKVLPVYALVISGPELTIQPASINASIDYKSYGSEHLRVVNTGGDYLYFNVGVGAAPLAQNGTAKSPVNKFAVDDPRIKAKVLEDENNSRKTEMRSGAVVVHNGVYLLEQNFDSGVFPPSGWNVVNNAPNGPSWNSAWSYGEGNYSGWGDAATVSSDAFGASAFDTELISPIISVSGISNVVLEYAANYQNYGNRDFFDLDVRVNGESQWTNVLRWNEDHGGLRSYGEFVYIGLDSLLGNAQSFQLRWRYYDHTPGAWNWYAQIDNVVVTGQAAPWLTIYPAWGSINPGGDTYVTAYFDGTQVETGQFNASLIFNSNAVNNPVVTVPVSLTIAAPPAILVTPDSISETIYKGDIVDRQVTITNTGDAMLYYSFNQFANASRQSQNNNSKIYPDDFVLAKNQKDTRTGHPVTNGWGGPDQHGYTWIDSDEPGGPIFSWQDISLTGTKVWLSDDDGVTVPLGIPFKFYNTNQEFVTISSNGFLTFGSEAYVYWNQEIPNPNAPNNLIAGLWDDLYPPAGGEILYQTFPDRFIVQFTKIPYIGDFTIRNTFQFILFPDGSILIQYLEAGETYSATVGIENESGTSGLQVAFNTPYIQNRKAVLFLPGTGPWVTPYPDAGAIPAGASQIVTLTLDARELSIGDHNANLMISSNAYGTPVVDLGVHAKVFDNYIPQIQPVAPILLAETISGQVTITATDPDDSSVSITLLNTPSFVSLISQSNGSATYSINPSIGHAGSYNLVIQATDARGGQDVDTLQLTVIPYGVESFSLVDKRNGNVITTSSGNLTINRSDPNSAYYLVRANTNPALVGSVVFSINGKSKKSSATSPYLLDEKEVKNLRVGSYQLKAEAFTLSGGKGQAGRAVTATLDIVNQPVVSTATISEAMINIVPNPVEDVLTVQLTGNVEGNLDLAILNSTGLRVYHLQTTTAGLHSLSINMAEMGLVSGIYYMQITTEKGERITTRIVKK